MKLYLLCAAALLASSGLAPAEDKNPGHLKMALVNLRCVFTDTPDAKANRANLDANLRRHLSFIDRAAARGAEFVGFPELSLNGYRFSKHTTWLKLDGPEVAALAKKAKEKGIYVSAGLAEVDPDGKRWNTHVVLGPDGKLAGKHHKIWLTSEKNYTEAGKDHNVFVVKGTKVGICTCADGTDYNNLKALADGGAKIIYGPHANTTGGTTAGWYAFRAKWGGPWDGKYAGGSKVPSGGWIAQLKVYAALHNHAAVYNPDYDPPAKQDGGKGWASGAWFLGPDGKTLAQMPPSTRKSDSKEYVLIYNIPLAGESK